MNIIAVIPARAGSKRIPKKNIKDLKGKPLLVWSIETAQKVSFSHIVVSTDTPQVAEIARNSGAEVPFLRASKNATDESNVISAVEEVINFYKSKGEPVDAVMLLQPTSPFRTHETVKKAIEIFKTFGGDSVVSVSAARTHPYWCKQINDGILYPFDSSYDIELRSQDLPEVYQLNGAIYLASIETLQTRRSFYSQNTRALLIDSVEESLDIDTPFDWLVAETIANRRSNKK